MMKGLCARKREFKNIQKIVSAFGFLDEEKILLIRYSHFADNFVQDLPDRR